MADKKEKDLTALAQSSSVTSDSFIRMVDKDGKSVKIARDIFLQAIRDALPGVLSSLSGTATQFLAKTSSGGIGYETLANAAALLGGVKVYDNAITDCNDRLNITGIAVDFFSSVEPANMPPSATSHYSIMLTVGKYKSSYPHAFQIWIDHKAYAAYRIHFDNNANKSWKTISTE